MATATRTRERIFSIVMWVVSVVFAGFLIGLGGLIIQDLPKVGEPVRLEQFLDSEQIARIQAERGSLERARQEIQARLDQAQSRLQNAENDYAAAQVSFDNWIATRTATSDPSQDPEVLRRQRALDNLNAAARAAEQARDDIATEIAGNERAAQALDRDEQSLRDAAYPRYERAEFFQELKVFLWRLLLTLPLLVAAAWLLFQKNKGDYWPLKRGFILFAAFAFFVELVPYLPDYGWYVRFGVGILLTAVLSHFAIKWMRRYLAAREAEEQKAEVERKRSIQYEEALRKMAAKTCPSCERPIATTGDAPTDFCVHCGLRLFDHCHVCDTRKYVFFRFCMKCGTPAGKSQPAAAA